MRTVYLPGDPKETKYVDQLWLIANLLERDTTMYLTSRHYGRVVAELRAQHGAPPSDPGVLEFGQKERSFSRRFEGKDRMSYCLTVINSGTDDVAEVNRKNCDTPGAIDFQDKMARLRTN